jgi:hypothetical protein
VAIVWAELLKNSAAWRVIVEIVAFVIEGDFMKKRN